MTAASKIVWGVDWPGDYGPSFADATYPDWDAQLNHHFEQSLSEADRTRYGSPARFRYISARKHYQCEAALGPLEDFEKPRNLAFRQRPKRLTSAFWVHGQKLIFEAALKDLVEVCEPGVHDFWPQTVSLPGWQRSRKTYYGVLICNWLDSFLPDQSPGDWDPHVNAAGGEERDTLALDAAAVAGKHLWRERRLIQPSFFLSEALKADIDRAGLTLPEHGPVRLL